MLYYGNGNVDLYSFAIIEGITHVSLMEIAGYVGVIYCTWAIGQFFDKNKAGSYFKALGSYILGTLTSVLLAIAIGVTIDIFIKH